MPHPFIRTAATAATHGPGDPVGPESTSALPSPGFAPDRPGSPDSLAVFVVDDSDDFREMLVALLEAGGHRVVGEATNGAEALERIPEANPDVVLMDIRMPGIDGVEATRRLKALRGDIGVVALTAHEDQTIVREMLVAGASGYVLKDSDGDDILAAVAEAAHGGAVLSPGVTPTVIEQLTEALEMERRRARELEEAHVALLERSARRHEFVSRLGHELRTPVTVILGITRTLAGGVADPEQQRDLLDRLFTRTSALAKLVERFQTAMDAGTEDLVDVVAAAREVAEERDQVRVEVVGTMPPAWANAVLSRRILEEIVENARQFSPPGTPVVVSVSAANGSVAVRVTDQGPGVRPEDAERIFEPLEQAESLDVRIHQGAGMGLSLGRAAARAMDGDLVLESSGPDGSTFLWTVPLPREPR